MPPKSKKATSAKAKKDIKKDVTKKLQKKAQKDSQKRREGVKKTAREIKEESKKAADAKKAKSKAKPKKSKNVPFRKRNTALFQNKKVRKIGIGQALRPKQDLRRFVKWPSYIKRQRQKALLRQRLKVPPAINQFKAVLDRSTRSRLFRLIHSYRPLPKRSRREMLKSLAKKKLEDPNQPPPAKRLTVSVGIRLATPLVEQKKASLVVIANDVEPIELVMWLPALCKKLHVPFCVVKNAASLGRLVNVKRATCVTFTKINAKDKPKLEKILEAIKVRYTPRQEDAHKHWGGLHLGKRHDAKMRRHQIAAAAAAGRTLKK
eukprot:RCo005393